MNEQNIAGRIRRVASSEIPSQAGSRSDERSTLLMAGLLVIGMLAWAGIMLLGTVVVVSDVVPSI